MSVDRMSDIQHTEPSKPAGLSEIAEDFKEESLEVQLACERYLWPEGFCGNLDHR